MAEKRRGSYTPEFREKAADLAMASNAHIGDIANTLNLVPSTLSNWVARRKKQLFEQSQSQGSSDDNAKQLSLTGKQTKPDPELQPEIDRLRLEIQRLRQERKVVKEAILLLTTGA